MKRYYWILLTIGLTMISLATAQAADPQIGQPVSAIRGEVAAMYTGCGGEIAPVSNENYEQEVVMLVNENRAELGLPPLKAAELLYRSARYHAADMGDDNYFEHDSHDRVDGTLRLVSPLCQFSDRMITYGYDFVSGAENIAAGQQTPAEVMAAWLNSSGHRTNIESDLYWEIGVGYYDAAGDDTPYWVQNFGRRLDVYPLIINREAIETSTPNVSLYLYGVGTWDEYRLRNDSDDWSAWQSLTSENISWTLNNEAGERTVSVELRSGSNSTSSSDTIMLSGTASTATATPTPASTEATATPTPTTTAETTTPTLTPTAISTGRPTVPAGSTATQTPTPILATATPGARPTTDSGRTPTATSGVPRPSESLTGQVTLQGRSDHSEIEVWLSPQACGDTVEGVMVTTTASDGSFTVTNPDGAVYDCLYVQFDNYLLGQRGVPFKGDVGSIRLLGGDINKDNIINIFDVAYIGLRYDGDDLSADINGDKAINIFDMALVGNNYQQTGPLTTWE